MNINKLLKKSQNDWRLVLTKASVLEGEGALSDAIQIYEAYLLKAPQDAQVQELLGTALLKAGRLAKSHKAFSRALQSGGRRPSLFLHKGICEGRLGETDAALESFHKALDVDPSYALAQNNIGKLLSDLGRNTEAVSYFEAALVLNPDYLDAAFNLGVTRYVLKNYEAALRDFEGVLFRSAEHPKALFYRLLTLRSLDQIGEAELEDALKNLLDRFPHVAEIPNALGDLCMKQKRLQRALELFDQAISLDFAFAPAHLNRGAVLNGLSRYSEAIGCFEQALDLNGQLSEAYVNCSFSYNGLSLFDEALACADQAIAMSPESAAARINRSAALTGLQRYELAIETLGDVLTTADLAVEALNARATAYMGLEQLDLALKDLDEAFLLNASSAETCVNRALVALALLDLEAAQHFLDRALLLEPEMEEAHYNRGLIALIQGHLPRGFLGYEWRWRGPLRGRVRDFGCPLWLGAEPLSGKRLLVSVEQGLGDFIQFARYLPRLSERAGEVVVEVPGVLRELLQTLEGSYRWVVAGDSLPLVDVFCPLMSLPLAFGTTLESIPGEGPYLKVPASAAKVWSQRLGDRVRPRVGLVWSGSKAHVNDRNRSLSFASVLALLDEAYEVHVLQKELREGDRDLVLSSGVHFHGESLSDFSDTAGLMGEMDLVISVDTSVAHLAGALGLPVWILLPFSPDFRWLLDRSDSPWYPTARLYRQEVRGDWSGVIARVKQALSAWAK